MPYAALVLVPIWACKAQPIPDADGSDLWNKVHGMNPVAPATPAAPAAPATQAVEPQVEWKGEVVFSEMKKELGDVKRGEMATHVFTITNNTDRVLHVKNVRGS